MSELSVTGFDGEVAYAGRLDLLAAQEQLLAECQPGSLSYVRGLAERYSSNPAFPRACEMIADAMYDSDPDRPINNVQSMVMGLLVGVRVLEIAGCGDVLAAADAEITMLKGSVILMAVAQLGERTALNSIVFSAAQTGNRTTGNLAGKLTQVYPADATQAYTESGYGLAMHLANVQLRAREIQLLDDMFPGGDGLPSLGEWFE